MLSNRDHPDSHETIVVVLGVVVVLFVSICVEEVFTYLGDVNVVVVVEVAVVLDIVVMVVEEVNKVVVFEYAVVVVVVVEVAEIIVLVFVPKMLSKRLH